jgi:hypothetical protein
MANDGAYSADAARVNIDRKNNLCIAAKIGGAK